MKVFFPFLAYTKIWFDFLYLEKDDRLHYTFSNFLITLYITMPNMNAFFHIFSLLYFTSDYF